MKLSYSNIMAAMAELKLFKTIGATKMAKGLEGASSSTRRSSGYGSGYFKQNRRKQLAISKKRGMKKSHRRSYG